MPILAASVAGTGVLGFAGHPAFLILGLRSIKHGHWIMFLIVNSHSAVLGNRGPDVTHKGQARRSRFGGETARLRFAPLASVC